MSTESKSLFHIVTPASAMANPEPVPVPAHFEQAATRDFVGLTAPKDASGLLASPVQLEALMGGLKSGESLIACLDFSAAKSAGLSVEIIGSGSNKRDAAIRSALLGRLLDAALASGLPLVEVSPQRKRRSRRKLPHTSLLAPAGVALPLGAAPVRTRAGQAPAAVAHDWRGKSHDAIVFSPTAKGSHLAGLGAAVAAITTALAIEVSMANAPFDAALLKQIAEVRVRVADRQQADAGKFVHDQRYMDADRRLEALTLAGCGIHFSVSVRSKRRLEACEVSALSAALFGTPHAADQQGHLSGLRSLYPRDEAVHSFFGIVAAAVGPALERRDAALLDGLDGNVIGRLKSGPVIRMAVAEPRSHTYVIGRPGSGKSTLLLNLILQDIENGDAVVLIDPHGDLWSDVRDRVPAHRLKDLQLVHMGDPALQPKLNILELGPGDPAQARARVVDTFYQLVRRLMFSGLTIDATGPMFNKYFRAALMLLLEGEGANASLLRFEAVFSDSDYRDKLLARPSVTAETRQQWKQILNVRANDHAFDNIVPWITSKLTQLTQSAILRPILGATTTSLDFDDVLANKKICLVNLANGRIGTEAAGLLGGILTHRLSEAAKRQEAVALEARHQASVYFDEFHTFASEFLRPLMAETRKYGLRVTLANQTLSQMVHNDISGGVLREVVGNCANTIVFAVDAEDARYLRPRFGAKMDVEALVSQPNFQAICQFQTRTGALGPFVVRTLPPPAPRRSRPVDRAKAAQVVKRLGGKKK